MNLIIFYYFNIHNHILVKLILYLLNANMGVNMYVNKDTVLINKIETFFQNFTSLALSKTDVRIFR